MDGHYSTQIFANDINYKNGSAGWAPIDDTLVPATASGYAYENHQNRYAVRFPADIGSGPIHFALGADWIDLSLVGAQGPGSVSGSTDTYTIPGATVAFTAESDQLKETLTLQSPSSPSTFTYQLHTSLGLSVSQNAAGGIDFVNSDGHVVFSFAPPYMYDQAGATSQNVTMQLTPGTNGPIVTVSADPAWLADPARQWPVVIDPTVTLGGSADCNMINGSSANTSYCTTSPAKIGWDGTSIYRYMLKFDLSSIPTNATILNSELDLRYSTASNTGEAVSLYQLTRAWTTGATWNKYDGTNAWTAAGGDFNPTAVSTVSNVSNTSAGWDRWFLTQLTQGWVNGTTANDGVLFKEPTETYKSVAQFYADRAFINNPYLQVNYDYWLGQQSFYTMAGTAQLDDRMDIGVNVANGNLVVHESDLTMPGIGLPLAIDRYYNSLNRSGSTPALSDIGNGWTVSTGADVGLSIYNDGSAAFHAPSGYQIPFTKNADGSFTAPPAIDATLVKNGDGTYTLAFHDSGEKYTFTSGGYLTSDVDASGNTLSFAYTTGTSGQLLSSITDTQGRTTSLSYVSFGGTQLIQKITDPAGRVYQYGYDSAHNLTTYTDPDNYQTTFAYDASNRLTQITDPNGNETKFAYDGSNRIASVTRVTNNATGAGYTTWFAYNSGNTVVTDANNHGTTYAYDTSGRVTSTTDPLGQVTTTSWTGDSHVGQVEQADAAATMYSYDGNNNVIQTTSSSGATTSASYSDPSQSYLPASTTDSAGNSTTYQYNAAGEPTVWMFANGQGRAQTYNSNGTVATSTDANGNVTTYTYGTRALVTSVTYPHQAGAASPLGTTTLTYNLDNSISTVVGGNGAMKRYSYDSLGRVTGITWTNADGTGGGAISYAYDADGNLLTQMQEGATTSYAYNALNQMTREMRPDGSTVTSTYNGVGNLLSQMDAAGTTQYAYDGDNRALTITDPWNNVTRYSYPVHTDGTYDVVLTYPNGISVDTTYNSDGNIGRILAQGLAGRTIVSRTYSYLDPQGQETGQRYSVTDETGATTNYAYDQVGRLTGATVNNGSSPAPAYTYDYDPNGNLLSEDLNGSSHTFTYNVVNQPTQADGATLTYDAEGNQLGSSTGWAFSYNTEGQTTSIQAPGGSSVPMTYSGIRQGVRTSAGSTTYQYDDRELAATATGAETTDVVYDPYSTLISERVNGSSYYYILDGTGSVVAVTDGDGNAVDTYSYDSYGNLLTSSAQVSNPFEYAGAVWDASTGLYKMGDRYYDPLRAGFTQLDPAGSGSYLYAGDDPVDNYDPTGDWTCGYNGWHCQSARAQYCSAGCALLEIDLTAAFGYNGTSVALQAGGLHTTLHDPTFGALFRQKSGAYMTNHGYLEAWANFWYGPNSPWGQLVLDTFFLRINMWPNGSALPWTWSCSCDGN